MSVAIEAIFCTSAAPCVVMRTVVQVILARFSLAIVAKGACQ